MFWKKTKNTNDQDVDLSEEYQRVFRDGEVLASPMSKHSKEMLQAKDVSAAVSLLNFLDRLSGYAYVHNREDARDYSDWVQSFLREFYQAKTGDKLDTFTISSLRDLLAVNSEHCINEEDFQTFFDENGCITKTFEQVCSVVLRIGSTAGVSQRVYANSKFYDDQFELAAHNVNVELTMDYGVYGLTEPTPRGTVRTRDGVGIDINIVNKMLKVLRGVEKDRALAWKVFPALHDTYSGEDVPLEIIALFDDAFPEGHPFFADDKMDVLTKNFFETVLTVGRDGHIQLDTSYFDQQIDFIKRTKGRHFNL